MDRRTNPTAVVCLLFALCALPTPAQDGFLQKESPSLKWLADGDVLVTNPAENQARPSMASAPNGDLYVAVHNQDANAIDVYRSTDGGTTWIFFIDFSTGSDLRHPSIAYAEGSDDEKWVFVAFEKVNADDSREVWVIRFDRDDPAGTNDFVKVVGPLTFSSPSEPIKPRITTDNIEYGSSYYVYVTYTGYSASTYPVFFSRSTDRGLTWSTPTNVTGGSASTTWPSRPDIAFGYAGLFIAYVKPGGTGNPTANKIWVIESNNAGSSWHTPIQLTGSLTQPLHPTVAAAHDRNSVLVVNTREPFGYWDLESAYSTDGGATWSLNRELPHTLDTEWFPDVEASHNLAGTGRFHVAYKGIEDGVHGIWYTQAATSDPGAWATPIRVSESTTVSGTYSRSTIAIDPTEPPTTGACVAWTDYRGTKYDAYFARDWTIFEDGFESGNTTAWSTTVGGP